MPQPPRVKQRQAPEAARAHHEPAPAAQRTDGLAQSTPFLAYQHARFNPPSLSPGEILALQRVAGNRAVTDLLNRLAAPAAAQPGARVQTPARQGAPDAQRAAPSGVGLQRFIDRQGLITRAGRPTKNFG